MSMQSNVTTMLQNQGIAFEIIEIPFSEDKKPIRSLEELLTSKDLDPTSVVRSVVFKGEHTGFCLLAVAGAGRADWAKLRNHLGERKCRMAEFDEVPEATGYVVGAVPPVALPSTLKVLVDQSVKAYEKVVIGSGVLGYAIALSRQDLMQLLANAEVGDFVKFEA